MSTPHYDPDLGLTHDHGANAAWNATYFAETAPLPDDPNAALPDPNAPLD